MAVVTERQRLDLQSRTEEIKKKLKAVAQDLLLRLSRVEQFPESLCIINGLSVIKEWAIQNAEVIGQNEAKFSLVWSDVNEALSGKYRDEVIYVYKTRARQHIGFAHRAKRPDVNAAITRFEKAARAALEFLSADQLSEILALVDLQHRKENDLTILAPPTLLSGNVIDGVGVVKKMAVQNGRRDRGCHNENEITDSCIINMTAQHRTCGRKSHYPQLMVLPVSRTFDGVVSGECFLQPFSEKVYRKLHQAIQNLQRKHGRRFTTTIKPAGYNGLKMDSICVWRVE